MTGCPLCGGEVLSDHDAVVLESGDLAHETCHREPAAAGTDQARLSGWGE